MGKWWNKISVTCESKWFIFIILNNQNIEHLVKKKSQSSMSLELLRYPSHLKQTNNLYFTEIKSQSLVSYKYDLKTNFGIIFLHVFTKSILVFLA